MSEQRPTGWEGADRWFASGDRDDGPGDGTGSGDGSAEAPPAPLTCSVCGAELEADQTYCLECGSPTPLAPRLRRGGRTAAILAGAMIVLGLGAGALAYAVVKDDDAGGSSGASTVTTTDALTIVTTGTVPVVPLPPETAPTTGGLPVDPSVTTPTSPTSDTTGTTSTTGTATGFDTVTGPASTPTTAPETTTEATTEATTASTPPATTDSGPSGSSDWPSGTTAWTAVLSSVRNEADARAAKARVAAAGNPAGVLFSSDFAGLRAGYWVVFSGTYDSQSTAIAQAVKLRPDFPTAYARRIEG